jgi:hypothetical protein
LRRRKEPQQIPEQVIIQKVVFSEDKSHLPDHITLWTEQKVVMNDSSFSCGMHDLVSIETVPPFTFTESSDSLYNLCAPSLMLAFGSLVEGTRISEQWEAMRIPPPKDQN